ncbi:MAG TPA: alpha/beta hydrolase family protein [Bacteroidales bacterium]|nr:alpha/beta hydrolase family protein [Bacteroidales bacterium]
MKRYFLCYLVLCLFIVETSVYSQQKDKQVNESIALVPDEENLDVFTQWIRWNNPKSMLINHLTKQAVVMYDNRNATVAGLNYENDWLERQNFVKGKLSVLIGQFPEKTSLNTKVTGTIKKDGYRIEKIVFESFPGFYVTGCLYIPEKIKGRVPAVLNLIGHEQDGFREKLDQVINYNLMKKGMIVFTIDPLSQGEHVQNYDTTVKFSSVGYSVVEHCYFGNQVFLSGYSSAYYFIWDGIRAIDLLLSRKDVDPERIGVTGFSGGGSVSAYLGAVDDRIKVAVPSSWSVANKRLLETKGAQDAEADLYQSAVNGISFEDLLEVRAPKPTLLTFTSRDQYLCLQGARDAYSEAKRAYEIFGKPDNLAMVEDDSKHWLTPKIRLAIYSFFMKHFGLQGDPAELEAEILTKEELQVTPTGQIFTSLGGKMVFDVNKEITEKLLSGIEKSRQNQPEHIKYVKEKAMQLSGYQPPQNIDYKPFINGKYQRDGYTVGKYAITGEGDYAIPFLLFVPDDNLAKHPAIIYLNSAGKLSDAVPGGPIEKLVKNGYIVAAVDVIGSGETRNTAARELTDGYTAMLIGRSVVGIQAEDIVRIAGMLQKFVGVDPDKIGAVGINELCIPLIHAAAFDETIRSIVLQGSLASYSSVAMNRDYRIGFHPRENGGYWHPYELDFTWGVAGALTAYDLPDLLATIAPRKVAISGMKNQMMEPADQQLVLNETEYPRTVYNEKKVSENLKIVQGNDSIVDMVEWALSGDQ